MNAIANKAAKRLVTQHARQYEPEDPFYEFWTDSKGKQRRRKVSDVLIESKRVETDFVTSSETASSGLDSCRGSSTS